MSTEQGQRQLIVDISREVVMQLAPQELPVFRAQSRAYLAAPGAILESQGNRDAMLGFDLGATATFLTPFVLAVTTQAVGFLIQEARQSLGTQSATLVDDLVKAMFKKFRPANDEQPGRVEMPSLSSEQLKAVHRLAVEEGRRLKLSAERADKLADALVGGLVVAEA